MKDIQEQQGGLRTGEIAFGRAGGSRDGLQSGRFPSVAGRAGGQTRVLFLMGKEAVNLQHDKVGEIDVGASA